MRARQRVSYFIEDTKDKTKLHTLGVNCLAISKSYQTDTQLSAQSGEIEGEDGVEKENTPTNSDSYERILYTGGRDNSIKCWKTETLQNSESKIGSTGNGNERVLKSEWTSSLQLHVDWVNDIKLCCNEFILASCSSDSTVTLWRSFKPEENKNTISCTLRGHSDYVKVLGYSEKNHLLASGGLDKKVLLWDLASPHSPVSRYAFEPDGTPSVHSSWAAGINGSTMLYDKFENPKAGIYSLATSENGDTIVTGSSDKIIRVWDSRTVKERIKLKGHTENIRSVLVNQDGTRVISCSSDFTVKVWDLGQQRCAQTFDLHEDSVWSLACDHSFTKVFSGGRDKKIWCTDLKTGESILLIEEESPVLAMALVDSEDSLWVSTTKSEIKQWVLPSSVSGSTSLRASPISCIQGRPAFVKYHVLNNRKSVLTQDSNNSIQLWDVTNGLKVDDNIEGEWKDVVESIETRFEMRFIPNWFTASIKGGSLYIHLEYPQCFSATVDASFAKFPDSPLDLSKIKVNLGERILNALFERWISKRNVMNKKSADNNQQEEQEGQEPQNLPKFNLPDDTKVVVSDCQTGVPVLRLPIYGIKGTEKLDLWIENCLLHNKYDTGPDIYFSFSLTPLEGTSLPAIFTGKEKLKASAYLKIKKVLIYVAEKLPVKLLEQEKEKDGESSPRSDKEKSVVEPHEYLELYCKNKLLDPEWDLGTVNVYIWKSNEVMMFYYRKKKE